MGKFDLPLGKSPERTPSPEEEKFKDQLFEKLTTAIEAILSLRLEIRSYKKMIEVAIDVDNGEKSDGVEAIKKLSEKELAKLEEAYSKLAEEIVDLKETIELVEKGGLN